MKNKFIIGIISFLVIFVGISGCIDTGSDDKSTNSTVNSNNQVSKDTTSSKSTSSSSASKSSSSKSSSSSICPECDGKGVVECYNAVTGSATCDGTGIVQGGSTAGQTCRICGGTGQITCPTCGGDGYT